MNPADVLQFQCTACGMSLTVPVQMAGVSGPCPGCGQTVTSPQAPAPFLAPAPMFAPPEEPAYQQQPVPEAPVYAAMPSYQPPPEPVMPQQPPAWGVPPMNGGLMMPQPTPANNFASMQAPAQGMPEGMPEMQPGLGQTMFPSAESLLYPGGMAPVAVSSPGFLSTQAGCRLPPKRNPGQAPVMGLPPATGGNPAWGAAPMAAVTVNLPTQGPAPLAAGIPHQMLGAAPPTVSARLIPGGMSQFAPPMQGAHVQMTNTFAGGSLLGRETASQPVTPATQLLGPVAPRLPGRQLSALRPSRGTNFIRLGLAALFLLGFLGIVAYMFKDAFVKELLPMVFAPAADPTPAPPAVLELTIQPGGMAPVPSAPVAEEVVKPAEPQTGTPQVVAVPTPPVTAAPAPVVPTPVAPPVELTQSSTGEVMPAAAQPAMDALKAFLAAPTVTERIKYTLGTEDLMPIIAKYYSQNQDGPTQVDHIAYSRYDLNPELGNGAHCIFHLESKTWEYPVPVMLEEHGDGWKVDWLAFIELKERKLEAFFQNYAEGSAVFHVGIYRQHYFEGDVPNRDQKDVFSLGLPKPNPFRKAVFLHKDSALSKQLAERLPWETHVWAIVKLEWKKLGTQQWVELVEVPQMHWYSLPTPTLVSGTNAAPAGGEKLQQGVRKGGTAKDSPPPSTQKSPSSKAR